MDSVEKSEESGNLALTASKQYKPHFTAKQIRNAALSLASTANTTEFYSAFVRSDKRGETRKDINGRFAEELLKVFKKVAQNLGKSKQTSSNNNKKSRYMFLIKVCIIHMVMCTVLEMGVNETFFIS